MVIGLKCYINRLRMRSWKYEETWLNSVLHLDFAIAIAIDIPSPKFILKHHSPTQLEKQEKESSAFEAVTSELVWQMIKLVTELYNRVSRTMHRLMTINLSPWGALCWYREMQYMERTQLMNWFRSGTSRRTCIAYRGEQAWFMPRFACPLWWKNKHQIVRHYRNMRNQIQLWMMSRFGSWSARTLGFQLLSPA